MQSKFEHQRHLGHARAEIVVQILGDARALLVQHRLLFQQPHSCAQSAERDVTHHGDNCGREGHHQQRTKPPGLPNKRTHIERQIETRLIPNAGFVAGGDFKFVMARRQMRILGDSFGSTFDSFGVESFQVIAKLNILR